MDVSAVGQAQNAQGPSNSAATQQQQPATPPPAPNTAEEDSVEISADAKTRASQSVLDK